MSPLSVILLKEFFCLPVPLEMVDLVSPPSTAFNRFQLFSCLPYTGFLCYTLFTIYPPQFVFVLNGPYQPLLPPFFLIIFFSHQGWLKVYKLRNMWTLHLHTVHSSPGARPEENMQHSTKYLAKLKKKVSIRKFLQPKMIFLR